ncbi:MAG: hypothetical protein F4153_08110 [Acidimicrobiia bacterium]|nr:hypothetical protein [Acidimicrobiia bacterium]
MGTEVVEAAMEDHRSAPIDPRLRAALEFLTVFVPSEATIRAEHVQALRDAGLSSQAIRDLMYASWCFMNLSKWMDAYDAPLHDERRKRWAARAIWRMPYTRASVPPS